MVEYPRSTDNAALALNLAANLISTHMIAQAQISKYKTVVDISMETQSLANRLLEWLKDKNQ